MHCLAKHSCPTECVSTCGELLYEIPIHPWQNVIPSMFMFNARSYSTALQYSCGFWRWTVMRVLEEGCKQTVLCTWHQPLPLIPCPRGWHRNQFWLHPHSQSQTWSETGAAEAKQTQLWWTTAMSLSGYKTPVPHREQRAGKPDLSFPWRSKWVATGSWLRWHHGGGAAGRWLSAFRRLSKWCQKPKIPHYSACVK